MRMTGPFEKNRPGWGAPSTGVERRFVRRTGAPPGGRDSPSNEWRISGCSRRAYAKPAAVRCMRWFGLYWVYCLRFSPLRGSRFQLGFTLVPRFLEPFHDAARHRSFPSEALARRRRSAARERGVQDLTTSPGEMTVARTGAVL